MNLEATLALGVLVTQGLSGSPPRHSAPLADYVMLSLRSDRDTYYVGEAMHLTIAATNVSEIPFVALRAQ